MLYRSHLTLCTTDYTFNSFHRTYSLIMKDYLWRTWRYLMRRYHPSYSQERRQKIWQVYLLQLRKEQLHSSRATSFWILLSMDLQIVSGPWFNRNRSSSYYRFMRFKCRRMQTSSSSPSCKSARLIPSLRPKSTCKRSLNSRTREHWRLTLKQSDYLQSTFCSISDRLPSSLQPFHSYIYCCRSWVSAERTRE